MLLKECSSDMHTELKKPCQRHEENHLGVRIFLMNDVGLLQIIELQC